MLLPSTSVYNPHSAFSRMFRYSKSYGSAGIQNAPRSKLNAEISTLYTSNIFIPEFVAGSVITFISGTLEVNESAETSPYTHVDGDKYQMTISSSGSYSTSISMTLLDDGVATSVYTVITRAEASYWLDANGDQILDVDGNPIEVIS